MRFVNRNQLLVELTANGMKIKDLADELNCTYSSVYNKLKKNRNFSEHDLFILSSLFSTQIFFLGKSDTKMVANNGNN